MLRQTWQILETLEIPFLCAFGEQDNVSRGDHSTLSGRIPGAKVHDHIVIPGAGHFIQEDQPAAIDDGRLLLELLIACRFRMGAAPPG